MPSSDSERRRQRDEPKPVIYLSEKGDKGLSFCFVFILYNRNMAEKIKKSKTRYWSGEVTRKSNALDLEEGVFTWRSPRRIALSLKKSALASIRRKGTPFQSAMSMLNFYINRAGRNLNAERKKILNQAKKELRKVFGRE